MTRPVVDQATRDRVSVEGLGQTLFVEAGAGTGKTSQLVERIANLVLVRGVSLARIAAITFTEAAAAELQSRIRVRFEEAAADAAEAGDQELLQRCRTAIDEADLAAISTLHGFASRLLGEFAVDAGLPPRVHVLDEVSSQLAQEHRWERFVDALYDDPANEDVLVRAALVGVALEPRYPGQATLKDVAAEFSQNWDRIEAMTHDVPPAVGEVDFSAFDAAVAEVLDLPARCTDVDDKFYVHLTGTVLPEMQAIASMQDPGRKLRAVCAAKWSTGRGGKKGAWGGDIDGCKATVKAVNEVAEEIRATAADEVLRHLLVHVAKEVWDAAQARRRDGGLEFHDLLVLARDMLRRSEQARGRLHERFAHLLLDEFQDTDPIQIELAMLIAASVRGELPEHWSELQVDDGRLFFVGDPKQSIYRFRRADIGLFLAARRRFEGDGRVLQLVTNFRTVAPILDWVNSLFDHVMDEELEGRQPRYEALSAHRPADSGADHRPVLLGGTHPDPKVKAEPLREAEARSVAAAIAQMREHPEQWPVQDRRAGGWRPARLSDVAILVPARTSVPYLRAELEAADLPYRLATGTLVYDTQEVRDALSALRAVDDPTDELSLVAALRSPLYACSDVDLFTYRQAGGQWNLRREPPDSVSDEHPVRLALAHLRSLWEQRWWLGPAAMLDRLVRERQAHLLAFGDPRPKEVWHRLRFLLDQARAFEEAGGGGLRAFVDWAELQGADGARVHEPLLPETDDDAVRILTVHGSKGLEFPITILSGMTTKPGRRRTGVSVLWDESGPPEVSLRKGVATANHDPRADIELEMDEHEKLRLLYVATTRARDHLLVSCHHKAFDAAKGPDTYGARIWTYFQDQPDLWRSLDDETADSAAAAAIAAAPVDEPVPTTAPTIEAAPAATAFEERADGQLTLLPLDPEPVGGAAHPATSAGAGVVQDPDRAEWIERRAELLDPQRVPRVVSATAVARQALGEPEVALADEDDDGAERPEDGSVPPRRRGRAGTAIGRAVHATLQVVDLAEPKDLELQVRRQCDLESIPEHEDTVAAMVRSALDAPAVRAAAEYPHHKELFVSAPLGDRVIEGYVDLLVETPEGLVVVDYKTDSVAGPAAIEEKLATYELQGASYAAALEEVTGLSVVDCRFVFCSPRGPIERSVTDLPGAMKRVRQLLDA